MGDAKNFLEVGRQDSALHDERGREINCPVPGVPIHEITSGGDSELERIKRLIKNEMSVTAQEHGFESFEEANDFEVGEEYDDTFDAPETKYMREEYLFPSTRDEESSPPTPKIGGDDSGLVADGEDNPETEPQSEEA